VETLSAASSGTNPSGTSYATVLETASSGSSNGTSTAAKDEKDSSPLSTGAIVGISVVGGVGVLGLILFIIWKMKQKRFASFDDDDGESTIYRFFRISFR
jgi:cytoskeletal protein RodZ